jgi:hypothetical protein
MIIPSRICKFSLILIQASTAAVVDVVDAEAVVAEEAALAMVIARTSLE